MDFHGNADMKDPFPCCGTIFNEKPMFSILGTCFASNKEIIERLPNLMNTVKIWMNTNDKHAPRERNQAIKKGLFDLSENHNLRSVSETKDFYALSLICL